MFELLTSSTSYDKTNSFFQKRNSTALFRTTNRYIENDLSRHFVIV